MITGITLQAHPNKDQKKILSQWMGCARFIWNAKCDEYRYLCQFAKRYLPVGTFPAMDQSYAKYKNRELSPWLFDCPSQVLRNSASAWYQTYQNFLKGKCGKPRRKKKSDVGSVLLTRELFSFEKCDDGVTRLYLGTRKHKLGYLSIKNHASYQEPNSIRIKRVCDRYTVSFCYEDGVSESDLPTQEKHLEYLRGLEKNELESITIGIDRGVKRPVQAGDQVFDLTPEQKRKKEAKERYIRKTQRRLSKQKKGSNRRKRKKKQLNKAHQKIRNIRKDFSHKTSYAIVNNPDHKVIVLEDLRTRQMTASSKTKKDEKTGKYLKNNRRQKAGLNRTILSQGWHQLETYLAYKSIKSGKALFKIPAHYTSQECGHCGYTHSSNRKSQERFQCASCGHSDNADRNAAEVIKKRAVERILDSGTELSSRGVLLDTGRGATNQTRRANASRASGREASKKKRKVANAA